MIDIVQQDKNIYTFQDFFYINKTNLCLSIRTISNIYNLKLCRIVYKLKTKYMSTIENYLQL